MQYFHNIINNEFSHLKEGPSTHWLVTGCAGFIGSHILEALLFLGQKVRGIDDFSTGKEENLEDVKKNVGSYWKNFEFFQGSLQDKKTCLKATSHIHVVLHFAAHNNNYPQKEHQGPILLNNVAAHLNVLKASVQSGVEKFLYASSCAVYGNVDDQYQSEKHARIPVDDYSLSKCINEVYSQKLSAKKDLSVIGMRYFNIYGPRQNYKNSDSPVIPRWLYLSYNKRPIDIYGSKDISRDFCHVYDVVRFTLRLALAEQKDISILNCGVGKKISLDLLGKTMEEELKKHNVSHSFQKINWHDRRKRSILHSCSSNQESQEKLNFQAKIGLSEGLKITIPWYFNSF